MFLTVGTGSKTFVAKDQLISDMFLQRGDPTLPQSWESDRVIQDNISEVWVLVLNHSVTQDRRQSDLKIPVLMYHKISA